MKNSNKASVTGDQNAADRGTVKIAVVVISIAVLFSAGFLWLLVYQNPVTENDQQTLNSQKRIQIMQKNLNDGRADRATFVYQAAVVENQLNDQLRWYGARAYGDLGRFTEASNILSECQAVECRQLEQRLALESRQQSKQ